MFCCLALFFLHSMLMLSYLLNVKYMYLEWFIITPNTLESLTLTDSSHIALPGNTVQSDSGTDLLLRHCNKSKIFNRGRVFPSGGETGGIPQSRLCPLHQGLVPPQKFLENNRENNSLLLKIAPHESTFWENP